MASGILENIREEVTCPICLELLKEPLSLDCGHSFCQDCLTVNSKKSMMGLEGKSNCPVCRVSYQPGNLRLNRHVANIVERLRKVSLSPEVAQKGNLCVHHEEKLLFFCKEDGKVICWICERSQQHCDHQTFLVEEVAQEYQKKLQDALERLQEEQKEAEKLEAQVREEVSSWKNQIQSEQQSVQAEFMRLRGILENEELKEMQMLKDEEKVILSDLADSKDELAQQTQLVGELISEVERRLLGSKLEMLQDVNDILKRSETLTLKKPKAFPKEQRRVFRAPDLREILCVFNKLTDVRRYWVHVTLNNLKIKSDVTISVDRRQVRYARKFGLSSTCPNGDFEDCSVLGYPLISSGKHYWEVDVSGKRAWILGVYGRKLSNCLFCFSKSNQHPYWRYKPKYGYWVIWLNDKGEYNTFEESSSSDSGPLTLSLGVPPRRIGVFLEYEAGTVSFFNITNHGSLIYRFSSCPFSQATFPYFNPMKCHIPMILCSPGS
ncbi:tripartite motif protein TRIM5 [Sus scrofa]|uniref:Tripartite motif protein TRIM5 n=1 Tax=Sus scrofa TaxID=9823 RepID=Q3MJK4_PIG|nr:tripartite motif protein TRIM5 [Sus scrofa]AAY40468.1 tripartite motif protein TRIM5 [Sus scrofa]